METMGEMAASSGDEDDLPVIEVHSQLQQEPNRNENLVLASPIEPFQSNTFGNELVSETSSATTATTETATASTTSATATSSSGGDAPVQRSLLKLKDFAVDPAKMFGNVANVSNNDNLSSINNDTDIVCLDTEASLSHADNRNNMDIVCEGDRVNMVSTWAQPGSLSSSMGSTMASFSSISEALRTRHVIYDLNGQKRRYAVFISAKNFSTSVFVHEPHLINLPRDQGSWSAVQLVFQPEGAPVPSHLEMRFLNGVQFTVSLPSSANTVLHEVSLGSSFALSLSRLATVNNLVSENLRRRFVSHAVVLDTNKATVVCVDSRGHFVYEPIFHHLYKGLTEGRTVVSDPDRLLSRAHLDVVSVHNHLRINIKSYEGKAYELSKGALEEYAKFFRDDAAFISECWHRFSALRPIAPATHAVRVVMNTNQASNTTINNAFRVVNSSVNNNMEANVMANPGMGNNSNVASNTMNSTTMTSSHVVVNSHIATNVMANQSLALNVMASSNMVGNPNPLANPCVATNAVHHQSVLANPNITPNVMVSEGMTSNAVANTNSNLNHQVPPVREDLSVNCPFCSLHFDRWSSPAFTVHIAYFHLPPLTDAQQCDMVGCSTVLKSRVAHVNHLLHHAGKGKKQVFLLCLEKLRNMLLQCPTSTKTSKPEGLNVEKHYVCPVCLRSLNNECGLLSHLSKKHLAELIMSNIPRLPPGSRHTCHYFKCMDKTFADPVLHFGLSHQIALPLIRMEKARKWSTWIGSNKSKTMRCPLSMCPIELKPAPDEILSHLYSHYVHIVEKEVTQLQRLFRLQPRQCPVCEFKAPLAAEVFRHYGIGHGMVIDCFLRDVSQSEAMVKPMLALRTSMVQIEPLHCAICFTEENNGKSKSASNDDKGQELRKQPLLFGSEKAWLLHLSKEHYQEELKTLFFQQYKKSWKENQFSCNTCKATSLTENELHLHVGVVHKQARSFKRLQYLRNNALEMREKYLIEAQTMAVKTAYAQFRAFCEQQNVSAVNCHVNVLHNFITNKYVVEKRGSECLEEVKQFIDLNDQLRALYNPSAAQQQVVSKHKEILETLTCLGSRLSLAPSNQNQQIQDRIEIAGNKGTEPAANQDESPEDFSIEYNVDQDDDDDDVVILDSPRPSQQVEEDNIEELVSTPETATIEEPLETITVKLPDFSTVVSNGDGGNVVASDVVSSTTEEGELRNESNNSNANLSKIFEPLRLRMSFSIGSEALHCSVCNETFTSITDLESHFSEENKVSHASCVVKCMFCDTNFQCEDEGTFESIEVALKIHHLTKRHLHNRFVHMFGSKLELIKEDLYNEEDVLTNSALVCPLCTTSGVSLDHVRHSAHHRKHVDTLRDFVSFCDLRQVSSVTCQEDDIIFFLRVTYPKLASRGVGLHQGLIVVSRVHKPSDDEMDVSSSTKIEAALKQLLPDKEATQPSLFVCYKCPRAFKHNQAEDMLIHLCQEHKAERKGYLVCEACDYLFEADYQLRLHVLDPIHHYNATQHKLSPFAFNRRQQSNANHAKDYCKLCEIPVTDAGHLALDAHVERVAFLTSFIEHCKKKEVCAVTCEEEKLGQFLAKSIEDINKDNDVDDKARYVREKTSAILSVLDNFHDPIRGNSVSKSKSLKKIVHQSVRKAAKDVSGQRRTSEDFDNDSNDSNPCNGIVSSKMDNLKSATKQSAENNSVDSLNKSESALSSRIATEIVGQQQMVEELGVNSNPNVLGNGQQDSLDSHLQREVVSIDKANFYDSLSKSEITDVTRCYICHLKFSHATYMLLHLRHIHRRPPMAFLIEKALDRVAKCHLCQVWCSSKLVMALHIDQHEHVDISCNDCRVKYKSVLDLYLKDKCRKNALPDAVKEETWQVLREAFKISSVGGRWNVMGTSLLNTNELSSLADRLRSKDDWRQMANQKQFQPSVLITEELKRRADEELTNHHKRTKLDPTEVEPPENSSICRGEEAATKAEVTSPTLKTSPPMISSSLPGASNSNPTPSSSYSNPAPSSTQKTLVGMTTKKALVVKKFKKSSKFVIDDEGSDEGINEAAVQSSKFDRTDGETKRKQLRVENSDVDEEMPIVSEIKVVCKPLTDCQQSSSIDLPTAKALIKETKALSGPKFSSEKASKVAKVSLVDISYDKKVGNKVRKHYKRLILDEKIEIVPGERKCKICEFKTESIVDFFSHIRDEHLKNQKDRTYVKKE